MSDFSERVRLTHVKHEQKMAGKALRKTPETAEWVVVRATGDREMRSFMGRGWEIMTYPSDNVYRSPVNTYMMRKARSAVVEELAAGPV